MEMPDCQISQFIYSSSTSVLITLLRADSTLVELPPDIGVKPCHSNIFTLATKCFHDVETAVFKKKKNNNLLTDPQYIDRFEFDQDLDVCKNVPNVH